MNSQKKSKVENKYSAKNTGNHYQSKHKKNIEALPFKTQRNVWTNKKRKRGGYQIYKTVNKQKIIPKNTPKAGNKQENLKQNNKKQKDEKFLTEAR